MNAKVHHTPSLLGLDQFKELLDIVRNADKYAELLQDLEDKQVAAAKIVALVAPADEIMSLRETVRDQKTQVELVLKTARTKSADILEKAQKEALKIVEESKAEIKSQLKNLEVRSKSLEGREATVAETTKKLVQDSTLLAKKTAEAEALYKQGFDLKALFSDKLRQIKALQE